MMLVAGSASNIDVVLAVNLQDIDADQDNNVPVYANIAGNTIMKHTHPYPNNMQ